jgi:hypothetical protein
MTHDGDYEMVPWVTYPIIEVSYWRMIMFVLLHHLVMIVELEDISLLTSLVTTNTEQTNEMVVISKIKRRTGYIIALQRRNRVT